MPNSQVTQILFDTTNGLHATGVEYVQGGASGPRITVNARQEVILAAGAIHTPQLLELSGIGQSSVLQAFGIEVLEALPGVGNNLQDHSLIHLEYPYLNPAIMDVDDFASNVTFNEASEAEYYASRTGPWTAKPSEAVAFPSLEQFVSNSSGLLASVTEDTTDYLPSNYESTLRAGYAKQQASILAELRNNNIPAFENLNNNAGGLDLANMRPFSRGTCHITSTDPFTSPAIDPRWLVHPFDFDLMIAAMEFNQQILDTPQVQQLQPSYRNIPRDADRDQLTSILQKGIGTEYHYSCTAAMLPRNLGGVVGPDLIVYGTDNLRIVDTSVFPMVPGAHLQAVTYAVAERASDIIKGLI